MDLFRASDEILRSAILSDDLAYRYQLSRVWDRDKRRVLFVMLNPSTADASVDDATIRSCIRLVRDWPGYGGFSVVNLFAFRATKPADMERAPDPIGPDNNDHIRRAIVNHDFTVGAWGAHKMARERSHEVMRIMHACAPEKMMHCLGRNADGSPKHPLYIKSGTFPEVWRGYMEKRHD